MVKEYIRQDEKYPFFRLVKNNLYELIEEDSRFSGLIGKVQREAKEDKFDIKEKDIKRYLAYILFRDYRMSRKLFFESIGSYPSISKVIYGDLRLFSDN
jgi:hypothetical protein